MELDSLDVKYAMIEDVGKRQTEADPLSAFAFGYATGRFRNAGIQFNSN